MQFDYDGILEELETQLSSKSSWRKTIFNGVYRRINEAISYVISKFVYLTEFLFGESSWDQAEQRSSLVARSDYYWYNPYRKVGAEGEISLSADPTFNASYIYTGENVVINQWDKFSDEDSETFVYATEDTTYYKNTVGNQAIPVKEGVPKEVVFIAKGLASEQLIISSDSVDNTEVYVYLVDANNDILAVFVRTEQDVTTKLFFINDLVNYHCSIKNSVTMDSVIITFGDGVKSRKLMLDDRLLIKYATTKGASGNITNTDTIVSVKDTLLDIEGNEITLYVNNDESIVNGSDSEDIESIRYNAPNLFSSGYRCGGYDDWVTILEADSRIYKTKIWSTDDIADDTLTTYQNKIFVVAIGIDGEELSSTTQDDITINYIKPIKSPTELVSWQTLNRVFAIFQGTVSVTNTITTTAKLLINTALNSEYDILNSTFQQNIYESNYTGVIDELSIVNYHNTDIYNGEKFEDTYSLYNHVILPSVLPADDSDLADQVLLLENSIEIWYRADAGSGELATAVRVGYESSGTIIADNGYTISDPAIVRNLNSITFSVDDLIGLSDYELMLIYQTQDGNGSFTNDIRLPQADFITDFDEGYNQFTISITG